MHTRVARTKLNSISKMSNQEHSTSTLTQDVFGKTRIGHGIGIETVAVITHNDDHIMIGCLHIDIYRIVCLATMRMKDGVVDGLGDCHMQVMEAERP